MGGGSSSPSASGGVNSREKTNNSVAQGKNRPIIRNEEVKREAGAEVMGSGCVSELSKRIEEKKTSKIQEVKQCSVLARDDKKRRRINSGRRKSQRSKQTCAKKLQLASLSVVSMMDKKSGAEAGQAQQVVQMENTVSRLCPLNSQSNSVGSQ